MLYLLAESEWAWLGELVKSAGPTATVVIAFIGYLYYKDKSDAKRAREKEISEEGRQTLFFEAMERIGNNCHLSHRQQSQAFIDFQREQTEAMLKSRGQLAETLDRASRAFGRVEAVLDRAETRKGAHG